MRLICVCADKITVVSSTHECPAAAQDCAGVKSKNTSVCFDNNKVYVNEKTGTSTTEVCSFGCTLITSPTESTTSKSSGGGPGPGGPNADETSAKPGMRVLFICAATFS